MKCIIVPVDFSEESMTALEYAFVWANVYRSDIQMVFVQTKKSSYAIEEKLEYENVEKQFQEIVHNYKHKMPEGCELSFIIKRGRVFQEVAEQAESFKNSLVICSTHGESGWSKFFIGTNAFRIVEATIRPVVVVSSKEYNYSEAPKTIVLPIDITKETREKVPLVASIANLFDAEVHILRVTSSSEKGIHNTLKLYANQVAKYFDEHSVKYKQELVIGENITDITIDYAKSVDADMIAIMTEQIKAWTNMFMGSYSQQMLNHSPIPVLCVTPSELTIKGSFRTT